MKVFELYFNPKNERKISESFQYKPKDAYEGKLGRIYLIGEISDPESRDRSFLQNIFHVTKEHFYKNTSLSPEKALKETLQEVNDFIAKNKYGDRLSIVIISSKNFDLNLAKIGRIKIFLLKKEKAKDIGEDAGTEKTNLFHDMVSGKMKKEERLMVLTSEIYDFFRKEKLLEEITNKGPSQETIEKISKLQKEKQPNSSGVAFIIDHAISLKEKETKVISKERNEKFSFRKVFLKNISSLSKLRALNLKNNIPEIKIKRPFSEKNPFFLVALLVAVILLGAIAIKIENNIRTKKDREKIILIEEKISEGKEGNNIPLMKEALEDLSFLIEKESFEKEAMEMHSSLEKHLEDLFPREEVDNLSLVGTVEKMNPDQISLLNENVYLFSSSSSDVIVMNTQSGQANLQNLPTENNISLSSPSSEKVIAFSPPNNLFFVTGENYSLLKINLIEEQQEFVSLSSFLRRPYFLDSKGRIVYYIEKDPISWIKQEKAFVKNGKSLSIDGSIFVLDSENKIHKYHKGEKEGTINYSVFPPLKNKGKIYTHPNTPLFIADKKEKRIIILEKDGTIINQIFNEKFALLKDITITPDGKKIYLLLGEEVYSLGL